MPTCQGITSRGHRCKKIIKENGFCHHHSNKNLSNKQFGQCFKSRAGTSRNGAAVTLANINSQIITAEMIKERNEELNISDTKCNYCKKACDKLVNDHLIPSCSAKDLIFGQALEIFISIGFMEIFKNKDIF